MTLALVYIYKTGRGTREEAIYTDIVSKRPATPTLNRIGNFLWMNHSGLSSGILKIWPRERFFVSSCLISQQFSDTSNILSHVF